jgi:hypothetical protein
VQGLSPSKGATRSPMPRYPLLAAGSLVCLAALVSCAPGLQISDARLSGALSLRRNIVTVNNHVGRNRVVDSVLRMRGGGANSPPLPVVDTKPMPGMGKVTLRLSLNYKVDGGVIVAVGPSSTFGSGDIHRGKEAFPSNTLLSCRDSSGCLRMVSQKGQKGVGLYCASSAPIQKTNARLARALD